MNTAIQTGFAFLAAFVLFGFGYLLGRGHRFIDDTFHPELGLSCPLGTCPTCDAIDRKKRESRCPNRNAK